MDGEGRGEEELEIYACFSLKECGRAGMGNHGGIHSAIEQKNEVHMPASCRKIIVKLCVFLSVRKAPFCLSWLCCILVA